MELLKMSSLQSSRFIMIRIPCYAAGQRPFLSSGSSWTSTKPQACAISDDARRPKSDSGRPPKIGLAADVSSSGRAASLTNMKRGTGYRSSFSGIVATVFGASGMIGGAVCNRLGKHGAQMIIPYRGDPYNVQRLKVCGDLGQVLFTSFHLQDEASIRKAMSHSNVVFNLIGCQYTTRNFSFDDVHVQGARRLARLAREAGVKRFIHLSHLNAREHPERVFLPRGSAWLRSKWASEQAVMEEFPDATIFRSVDVYGEQDWFISYYLKRHSLNRDVPLWKKGEHIVKAPLHVSDLASGIMAAVNDPSTAGKIFEAMGPDRYLLSDLVDWMHYNLNRTPSLWGYKRTDLRFSPKTFLYGLLIENLPLGKRYFSVQTLDKLERTQVSDTPLGYPTLEALGVKPSPVEEKMPMHLAMLKECQYFEFSEQQKLEFIFPLKKLSSFDEKRLLLR